MIYISAAKIIDKYLIVKSSHTDINETIISLQNMPSVNRFNLYQYLKETVPFKNISLNDSISKWTEYKNDIIIFICLRKLLCNIDIPIIHSVELPINNPY
jgi:hypothetical protein